MSIKKYWPLLALVLVALVQCIYRDIQFEKTYTSDLRNRIVGARLQKDGIAPYFYKWKPGDKLRYYDPANFDSLKVANITATPFFHTLLYPLVELPQRTISQVWLVIEYILLLSSIMLALSLTVNSLQKITILLTTLLLLFTAAWKGHILTGQLYICIPFFAMCFYYYMQQKNSNYAAFLAGSFAIVLLLIRPNTLVFFLPFLLLLKQYNKRFIFLFFLPVIAIIYWNVGNKKEWLFWNNYKEAMAEQIKVHQDLYPHIVHNAPDPKPGAWEGFYIKYSKTVPSFSEKGNIFVLYQHIFHKKLSVSSLLLAASIIIALLLIVFLIAQKEAANISLPNIAIFGFCLYMISDLFSPIWRHQYNTVQWLFPLLVAAACYKASNKWIYIMILAGLLLNIINTYLIKMEHTIGEFILLGGLLLLSITRNLQSNQ